MSTMVDLTNQVCGGLHVQRIAERGSHGKGLKWHCICIPCKSACIVSAAAIKREQKSCGRCKLPRRRSGTTSICQQGYARMYLPEHPNAYANGSIQQHRFIMSEHLGRALLPSEVVHHKNGKRHDNRLENLELWVESHPSGRRIEDAVRDAIRTLQLYAPSKLK